MMVALAMLVVIQATGVGDGVAARPSAALAVGAIPMIWRVGRSVDARTGLKRCEVVSLGGDVVARLSERAPPEPASWSVVVGAGGVPGSVRYLRVRRSVHTSDDSGFQGAEAAAIVRALSAPGEFAFEWARPPDYAKSQGLFETGNFAAAARACERWVSGPMARAPPGTLAAPEAGFVPPSRLSASR